MREKAFWEVVWLGPHRDVYLNAGKIIGHLGCSAAEFLEKAKALPGYEAFRYDMAVRHLCDWQKREKGRYELHAQAKKTLRIILGPSPDDPEYEAWWRGRLISVRLEKEAGRTVSWAEEPPVPLKEEEEPPKKKGRKKK